MKQVLGFLCLFILYLSVSASGRGDYERDRGDRNQGRGQSRGSYGGRGGYGGYGQHGGRGQGYDRGNYGHGNRRGRGGRRGSWGRRGGWGHYPFWGGYGYGGWGGYPFYGGGYGYGLGYGGYGMGYGLAETSSASQLTGLMASSGASGLAMPHTVPYHLPNLPPKNVYTDFNMGPAPAPIIKSHAVPGDAYFVQTYLPGQDYIYNLMSDGDLYYHKVYVGGPDYDINLMQGGDTLIKDTWYSADDVDIDYFKEGDTLIKKDTFVTGTTDFDVAYGEDKTYYDKDVVHGNEGIDHDTFPDLLPSSAASGASLRSNAFP